MTLFRSFLSSTALLRTLLFCLAPLLIACDRTDEADAPSTRQPLSVKGRRTVIVYMAAQNSLGRLGYHDADSAEIMAGRKAIAADDRLLVFIDDDRAPRLYRVDSEREKPELLHVWKKDICSTAPERLREAVGKAADLSPADEYGLVLWSHATGWVPATEKDYERFERVSPYSFGIDSGPEGGLSNKGAMTDIHELAASLESTGRRFRFVFFDACLMGNVEVAYALRNAADYVIASPAQTPAAGANYTRQLAHGFFSSDPSDIARTYLSDIVNPDFAASYSDFGLPISCVRTDRLQALADLLYETLPGSSLQNGVFALADGLLNYQAYSEQYSYRPHNFDMRQALRRILLLEDVIRVEAQLDEAVAFYGSTPRFWIGPYIFNYQEMPETETDYCCLSMFLPLKKYADDADKRYNVYGNLNEAFRHTEWYEAAGFNRIGH